MAQSDARFGYRANLSRDSHDLGAPFGFTCAPGMELPIFADIATPGDSYYITHDLDFLRTNALAAPAMVDVKVHFESFFVPMQMLYQPFEDSVFSMKTLQSSNYILTQENRNTGLPLWDYGYIVASVNAFQPGTEHKHDCYRLADMLGLNADAWAYDTNNPSRTPYSPSFFPWQILAYNCIWQYYFRLDDKTSFENYTFNFDKLYQSGNPDQTDIISLHYRPWNFDYYTSMYRSPIVSNLSMQQVVPRDKYNDLFSSTVTGGLTQQINDTGQQTLNNQATRAFTSALTGNYVYQDTQVGFSTAMIRQMFANEKLAMITGRTRKTYDSQVLAHFGVRVPHDVKHDISLIGRDSYDLNIGEVTSLAATNDATLGELAGKGWARGQGNKHKFTAPCHGVVMTLFCVEPRQRYYGGFHKENAVTDVFDIPVPEFDRLGNQPVFRYEAGPKTASQDFADIIGWKERYYQFKRRMPRTTMAFERGQVRGTGVTNPYSAYFITNQPFGFSSSRPNTPRPDLASSFYIDPHALDELMLIPYFEGWKVGSETDTENWNATPWLAYARDPFIVDTNLKVTKVSWMSKDGEPIYPY